MCCGQALGAAGARDNHATDSLRKSIASCRILCPQQRRHSRPGCGLRIGHLPSRRRASCRHVGLNPCGRAKPWPALQRTRAWLLPPAASCHLGDPARRLPPGSPRRTLLLSRHTSWSCLCAMQRSARLLVQPACRRPPGFPGTVLLCSRRTLGPPAATACSSCCCGPPVWQVLGILSLERHRHLHGHNSPSS